MHSKQKEDTTHTHIYIYKKKSFLGAVWDLIAIILEINLASQFLTARFT